MAHHETDRPSAWVRRFAGLIRPAGTVLDVACGSGRHTRLLRALGHPVVAVDRDASLLRLVERGDPGVEAVCADLEAGAWPFGGRPFDGIVVTNYLHRPLFAHLRAALSPGGVLIYETFAQGNERYGRPANPAFLLRSSELLQQAAGLQVVAFEQGRVSDPRPAVMQRICAVRGVDPMPLAPGISGPDADGIRLE
jgi:SAM-dependent methyltransferase